jgi:3-oxoadipate enol-lactonase
VATARVNSIDIWYEFEGDGEPLVFHHGFAGPNESWPPVVYELRERYRVLLFDARAHGRTTMPDAATVTVPQFAADMAGLMDALGIETAHVGGVSMGGMVSAQFACDFPERVRSLLLCDTTAGNGGDPATAAVERELVELFERFERIVRKHGVRGLVERENRYRHDGDPHSSDSSQSLEEQDERNARKIKSMTDEGFIAANIALRTRPDLTARTPKIAAPTLVSCGEWDMFYPLAVRDHSLIENSRLATIRGAAHDSLNYRPQLWLHAVSEFLADVEADGDVRGEREYVE